MFLNLFFYAEFQPNQTQLARFHFLRLVDNITSTQTYFRVLNKVSHQDTGLPTATPMVATTVDIVIQTDDIIL